MVRLYAAYILYQVFFIYLNQEVIVIISQKYRGIVMSCLAAIMISVPIAFIMVVINLGFREGFLLAFLKSALVSILISIPLAAFGIPLAEKLTDRLIKK